jgi:molecular chaperone DnaK
MTRSTIDYGIDLGTTNSAIAVLNNVSTEIIKNNIDGDITPSVVSIKKDGMLYVGDRARGLLLKSDGDAYFEFKRRMGTEYEYVFKSSGRKMKPEEISAEVLKSLKSDVQQKRGEDLQAAVITVPAAFELHQCDATRKAAELAGLKGSPLLQEPVAAALAYGFQVDTQKTYWLVYDFGGGTFDAAIIQAEEGSINVVNHGGDNFLGGSDIDWAVVEKLILPQLSQAYNLPDFTRGNNRWRLPMLKLKRAVEIAKIDLSRTETAVIELDDSKFVDESGEEVNVDLRISRADLVRLAEPIISRSIEICKKTLKEKSLDTSAIEKVILVGGPTLAPYFREMLRTELGIPIDHSVDPLTVVARGAAVFAGTQRVPRDTVATPVTADEFSIDLKYKPVGHEPDPMVGGKVSSPSGASPAGYTLEFVNPKTQWRSGKATLREDGAFIVNLLAEKGERNTFAIELLDPTGARQKTVPTEITYTIGATVEEQPLINSMGIALDKNMVEVFFKKGSGLPLKKKGRKPVRTTIPLIKGREGAIYIKVLEGESDAADRNRELGTLKIGSDEIKRDLDIHSEIEVTLKISESRVITVNAYVPALDEEFECKVDMRKKAVAVDLDASFKRTMDRIKKLKASAETANDAKSLQKLEQLESSELLRELRTCLAAKNDFDAAEKFEKRHLEFMLQVDQIQGEIEWPKAVAEAREAIGDVVKLAEEHGSRDQQDRAHTLQREIDEIIAQKKTEDLRRKIDLSNRLYGEVLREVPGFWTGVFRRLQNQKGNMSDPARAEQLFDRGQAFIENDNLPGLRNVVFDLWKLCPADVAAESEGQRGVDANITMG